MRICTPHHPIDLFKRCALVVPAIVLAACQSPDAPRPLGPQAPPPPRIVEMGHKCNASDSRFALGLAITPEVLEDARNRTDAGTAITTPSGSIPTPADPQRLIIEVDAQGRMVGARCG